MTNFDTLDEQFNSEMWEIHKTAKQQCQGYRGTRFAQMLEKYGGVETAKRLLEKKEIHDGFIDLILCGCPHLTAEFLVLKPEYQSLFSELHRAEARRRLGK